jgi:homoserine kinase type II
MAVYTDVSFEDLEALLADYAVGAPLSFKGIAEGVENSNFYLRTTDSAFILTLYEKRVRESDLPFFLGLMEHLSSRGIACPIPVRRKDGSLFASVNGRPAALLAYLDGLSLRQPSASHCAAAGAALAALHDAGGDFPLTRQNALSLRGWGDLAVATAGRADSVQAGMRALIESALAWLEQNWPAGLPAGVIHADLFPDNVLFMDGQVSGLIDFYFACNDALAYDLAVLLNAWCFETDGAFNITKGKALLGAYHRHRSLSDAELAALPVLSQGAALRFLLTRLYDLLNHDPMALVRPKDPREFAKRLRFHQKVRNVSEYGF